MTREVERVLDRLWADQDDMSTALLALDDHLGCASLRAPSGYCLDIARASLAGASIAISISPAAPTASPSRWRL